MKVYGYQNSDGNITSYSETLIRGYNGGCALELVVEIPDELNPYETAMGNTAIISDSHPMVLNEVLHSKSGEPAISYPDMCTGKNVFRMLKIVQRNGWVSCAFTI